MPSYSTVHSAKRIGVLVHWKTSVLPECCFAEHICWNLASTSTSGLLCPPNLTGTSAPRLLVEERSFGQPCARTGAAPRSWLLQRFGDARSARAPGGHPHLGTIP